MVMVVSNDMLTGEVMAIFSLSLPQIYILLKRKPLLDDSLYLLVESYWGKQSAS
jgi:hypothetical protein